MQYALFAEGDKTSRFTKGSRQALSAGDVQWAGFIIGVLLDYIETVGLTTNIESNDTLPTHLG